MKSLFVRLWAVLTVVVLLVLTVFIATIAIWVLQVGQPTMMLYFGPNDLIFLNGGLVFAVVAVAIKMAAESMIVLKGAFA